MPDPPSCPRCGYDQSGVVASWERGGACPLEGICSECGLGFAWADVMRPERIRIAWFFEHARGMLRSYLAAWRTWMHAIAPPVFFATIRIEHPPIARRILAWPFVILVPLFAAGSLVALIDIAYLRPPPSFGSFFWACVNGLTEPLVTHYFEWVRPGSVRERLIVPVHEWPSFALPALAVAAAWPVAMLVLPETRSRARVRASHVLRAFAYSLWWLAIPAAIRLLNNAYTAFDPVTGPLRGGWMRALFYGVAGHVWLIAICAWIAWWWWLVVLRHWRLQHAGRAWCAGLVIALLSAAIPAGLPELIDILRYQLR